jgi:hypothetical protein
MPIEPWRLAALAAGLLVGLAAGAGQAADGSTRADAVARARLWGPPVARADLRHNPSGPGGFGSDDEPTCRFVPRKSSGATPKFECAFAEGEVLKVKYGSNPELYTEAAATRLLRALGAGADRVYLVRRLRCYGCPEDPHALLRCISSPLEEFRRQCEPLYGETTPTGEFKVKVDYGKYVDFAPAAIERRAEGEVIKTDDKEGWGWDELDEAQASGRGSTRAERDALRLVAVLLNHWDNKAENQRLLCLPGGHAPDGSCRKPFAYVQDVGGTFGHVGGETKAERKLDVEGWRSVPVWQDARTCRVGVKAPPLHGATFSEAVISEPGRRFLARRLRMLTRQQVRDLFEGSRFGEFEGASDASRDAGQWVSAFEDKVRQITEREPCPTR